MKRIYLVTWLFLLPFLTLRAGDDNPPAYGSISGNVVDAFSGQPMPYVNVVVRNSEDSILTGGITDEQGNFRIPRIPEGNNSVEIQFIGYEKIVKEIEVSRDQASHNLQTIDLSETSEQLEEVEIRGELSTVTQKIDRRVINVGKDLTATGTNASELLNNVQSVSVDQQTGAVSLRGNENVRILVDGRPTNVDPAQLLQQIPSSSIKSIELITNPSAKYNPEGMSGMINIVLHKNSGSGLNGSVNGGLTYGKNARYNGSLDLNYRRGIVNLYANYGGNSGKHEGGGRVLREDNASVSKFSNENYRQSHLLKTGADLYLNKANTLSVYTIQNYYKSIRMSGTMIYFEDILDSDNAGENRTEDYTGTYNLNYKREFQKEGHHIEFEISHSVTRELEDARFEQLLDFSDPTLNYMDDIRNDLTGSILNLDYVNPVMQNGRIELGLEYRVDRTVNRQVTDRHQFQYDDSGIKVPAVGGGFQTIPMGNTSFTYNRGIYSTYANYAQKFGKFSLQAGARLEKYEVEALFNELDDTGEYSDSKLTVYPSAFVTYTPGEKNQFQVSYSRRVDRPGISQVNPIRSSWSSPLTVFVGNPELRPQFTRSYELNYTRKLKKGSFTVGTFFRQINDNIIRYTNLDPLDENKVEVTYNNAEGENRYGTELSGMYRPTGWWSINTSFDLYSQHMTGYAFGNLVEVQNVTTNVRLNNTFNATENLSFQLFGMYRGANEVIQYVFKPMWMINTGMSLKVFQKKGTISFRVNDVFKTMRFRFESTNFYPSTGGFSWESRTAFLGYTHNFGSGEVRQRNRKTRDRNDLSGSEGF